MKSNRNNRNRYTLDITIYYYYYYYPSARRMAEESMSGENRTISEYFIINETNMEVRKKFKIDIFIL